MRNAAPPRPAPPRDRYVDETTDKVVNEEIDLEAARRLGLSQYEYFIDLVINISTHCTARTCCLCQCACAVHTRQYPGMHSQCASVTANNQLAVFHTDSI